jgi:hypothetical protein
MTKLNKDFHAKFQHLGFAAYRIKSGMACQTSTYKHYLNLQSFLKDNKVPFNLIRTKDTKLCRVFIKGIPPTAPPKTIKNELHELALEVQNVVPVTAWRDKTPLFMHILKLDNIPESENPAAEPYMG